LGWLAATAPPDVRRYSAECFRFGSRLVARVDRPHECLTFTGRSCTSVAACSGTSLRGASTSACKRTF